MSDFAWLRNFFAENGVEPRTEIGAVERTVTVAGTRFVFSAEGDYLRTETV
jgi:hypothetical protein